MLDYLAQSLVPLQVGQAPAPAPRSYENTVPELAKSSSGQTSSQYQAAQTPRQPTEVEKYQARKLADGRPTGPPPAFQASLLEVRSDIRYVIKQIEAAREEASNQRAVAAQGENPNPHAPTGQNARETPRVASG